MSELYDRDFYAWATEQAALLRAGRASELDWPNIAEEIESIGRSEKRALVSRLTVLLMHLLKSRFQPEQSSRSWQVSIANTRDELADHLEDNPSLRARLPEAMQTAYRRARRTASVETGMPENAFPIDCPWTFEQAMQD